MDIEEFRKDISNCTNTLHERFAKYGTEFVAGVGSLYDGIEGLKRSYDEAVKAINIWERIKGLRIGYDRIIFASDLSLEMLLSDIPAEVLSAFKKQMLMQNAKGNILRKTKLIDTLKAFFENDLNLTATAEKLDITRNTLANRLSKIKELSGYDPRKFNDAVKLKILTLINELDRENVQIYSSSV
jgi:carbohydrate diacid regulator